MDGTRFLRARRTCRVGRLVPGHLYLQGGEHLTRRQGVRGAWMDKQENSELRRNAAGPNTNEGRRSMYLSENNRELLIDLVWNKLDCIEVFDREDRRVVQKLESCLSELSGVRKSMGQARLLAQA